MSHFRRLTWHRTIRHKKVGLRGCKSLHQHGMPACVAAQRGFFAQELPRNGGFSSVNQKGFVMLAKMFPYADTLAKGHGGI